MEESKMKREDTILVDGYTVNIKYFKNGNRHVTGYNPTRQHEFNRIVKPGEALSIADVITEHDDVVNEFQEYNARVKQKELMMQRKKEYNWFQRRIHAIVRMLLKLL